MSTIVRFGLYNLLPALLAGGLAWLLISAGIRLLDIRHGRLRLCLLVAPPIKSTLVLLGLAPVLAWPDGIFRAWSAAAVGPRLAVPLFLLAVGLGLLARGLLDRRERRRALAESVPAAEASPRLQEAYLRAVRAFRRRPAEVTARCGCRPEPGAEVRVSRSSRLRAPSVVTTGDPVILFPEGLVSRLDDRELEGALAHEIAHLSLRGAGVCASARLGRWIMLINPFGALMARQLELEEEHACDDLATAATGDATTYAHMLLQGYRFASGRHAGILTTVPQLLGTRPGLSTRIERLMSERAPMEGMRRQRAAFCALWIVVILVVFVA